MLFFSARDDATTSRDALRGAAPGRTTTVPGDVAATVRAGNVVIRHPRTAAPVLAALVRDVTGLGPEEQEGLVRAGQGVVLERTTGGRVVAYASGRVLEADGPRDPDLRRFLEFWLGRAGDGRSGPGG